MPAGQRHEAVMVEHLMAHTAVKRGGHGRPKRRPQWIVGDNGYRSKRIRQYVRRRGIGATIPRKSTERRTGPCNRAIYRERNRVEWLINRLQHYRRSATRDEKRASTYLAMLTIGAIPLWL